MIGKRAVSYSPLLDRFAQFHELGCKVCIGGGNEFRMGCRDAFGKAPELKYLTAKGLVDGPGYRIGTAAAHTNRRGQVVQYLS